MKLIMVMDVGVLVIPMSDLYQAINYYSLGGVIN